MAIGYSLLLGVCADRSHGSLNVAVLFVGRDSTVGIATRYGLDGPGIESRWSEIFHTCPDRPWDPPVFLYSGCGVSFPGVTRPGCGVNLPFPLSAEVKERVALYLYSLSGPSSSVLGRNLPFTLTCALRY